MVYHTHPFTTHFFHLTSYLRKSSLSFDCHGIPTIWTHSILLNPSSPEEDLGCLQLCARARAAMNKTVHLPHHPGASVSAGSVLKNGTAGRAGSHIWSLIHFNIGRCYQIFLLRDLYQFILVPEVCRSYLQYFNNPVHLPPLPGICVLPHQMPSSGRWFKRDAFHDNTSWAALGDRHVPRGVPQMHF